MTDFQLKTEVRHSSYIYFLYAPPPHKKKHLQHPLMPIITASSSKITTVKFYLRASPATKAKGITEAKLQSQRKQDLSM